MAGDLRKRYRIWLLSVAIVLAAVAGRWVTYLSSAPIPSVAEWPDPAELESLTPFVEPVRAPVRADDGFPDEGGRDDPFHLPRAALPDAAPDTMPAPPRAALTVSAILITQERRVAVINNALFSAGDRLPGGARVAEIQKDRVIVVEPDGYRRALPVDPGGQS